MQHCMQKFFSNLSVPLLQIAGKTPQYCKSWVESLNGAGFSVCGIDQQGCGFSEGLECYVERFHYYVDDVLQFARCASETSTGSCCIVSIACIVLQLMRRLCT